MMELIQAIFSSGYYLISFLVIISVIVFVHEFGHYYIAVKSGVKVETFSIGFGKELFGFYDKRGTRWKISLLPLGGYVKMYGDADPASSADNKALGAMSAEDKKLAFHFKPLSIKAAIVAAGPFANFIFSIVLLAFFFAFIGRPETPPVVGEVIEGSAAEQAGLKSGDIFVEMEGREIKLFSDVQSVVRLRPETPLNTVIERDGQKIDIVLTPKLQETTDVFGNKVRIGLIGVATAGSNYRKLPATEAVPAAFTETYRICADTLTALGQIITGVRSTDELGGPIRIAKYSGQSASQGFATVLWFMAILSINLGLINLFPIPMLDGGHLLFYGIEAIRRKPLSIKSQEMIMKAGFALLISLMIFTTFNDIVQLNLF